MWNFMKILSSSPWASDLKFPDDLETLANDFNWSVTEDLADCAVVAEDETHPSGFEKGSKRHGRDSDNDSTSASSESTSSLSRETNRDGNQTSDITKTKEERRRCSSHYLARTPTKLPHSSTEFVSPDTRGRRAEYEYKGEKLRLMTLRIVLVDVFVSEKHRLGKWSSKRSPVEELRIESCSSIPLVEHSENDVMVISNGGKDDGATRTGPVKLARKRLFESELDNKISRKRSKVEASNKRNDGRKGKGEEKLNFERNEVTHPWLSRPQKSGCTLGKNAPKPSESHSKVMHLDDANNAAEVKRIKEVTTRIKKGNEEKEVNVVGSENLPNPYRTQPVISSGAVQKKSSSGKYKQEQAISSCHSLSMTESKSAAPFRSPEVTSTHNSGRRQLLFPSAAQRNPPPCCSLLEEPTPGVVSIKEPSSTPSVATSSGSDNPFQLDRWRQALALQELQRLYELSLKLQNRHLKLEEQKSISYKFKYGLSEVARLVMKKSLKSIVAEQERLESRNDPETINVNPEVVCQVEDHPEPNSGNNPLVQSSPSKCLNVPSDLSPSSPIPHDDIKTTTVSRGDDLSVDRKFVLKCENYQRSSLPGKNESCTSGVPQYGSIDVDISKLRNDITTPAFVQGVAAGFLNVFHRLERLEEQMAAKPGKA